VDGLGGAFGIAVSPDGKHVYATGYSDDALVMFDRESLHGYLSFRDAYIRDSGSGLPALNGAAHLAVSADGGYVFVVSQIDKAVVIFRTANPVPTLFSLQPASVGAGGAQFTLIVKGAGFVDGAEVWWDGSHPTATFFNSSEMRATIPAAWIAGAGNHTIKVKNPTPGGGDSFNTLTFKVIAPAATPIPSIDHLNPAGAKAGAANPQVDIYGSNFLTSSVVSLNGSSVIASFLDSTHLRVTIGSSFVAQPGTVNVKVYQNAIESNPVAFDVAAPGQNPVPSITSLNPDWRWSFGAASDQFTLIITGTNFIDGAVVYWNGDDRPTQFVSATKLKATISTSDQLWPGYNSVMVTNPTPGGGDSNVLTLIVRPWYPNYIPMVLKN
jgi:hypothetical protein